MKKLDKVLSILVISLTLVCITTSVFATSTALIDEMKGNANVNMGGLGNTGNKVLTIILNVAMIIAVLVIAILGVMYMLGSPEGKAEYKKNFMPFIVGAILTFGAAAIGKIIVTTAQSIV